MGYQEKFTEEEVEELFADDLSLAFSISELINKGGDIHVFLTKKLLERREAIEEYQRSQELSSNEDWKDWNSLQNTIDAEKARYINQTYLG